MRHVLLLFVAFAVIVSAQVQPPVPSPPPQTARQALIEMFRGKDPEAFAKHLPEVARQALTRKSDTPETSVVQKISTIGQQMTAGGKVETFDVGPTLLVLQTEGSEKEKTELIVEHDNFTGENDEIELSIHIYRNGEPTFLPAIPRLIFTMTQEKEVWRLSELTLAAHVPLTDPDYLKGLRRKEDESRENLASARVNVIASAELDYASKHPDRGYTCTLGELLKGDGLAPSGPDQPPTLPEVARNDPGLAAEESNGYHFALAGCNGSPALKFQVTATPVETDSEMKAFCSDESGQVRYDASGKGAACLRRGQPVNQGGNNAQID